MNENERLAYLARRLPVMRRLQEALEGKCNEATCPTDLASNRKGWSCRSCVILFRDVADLQKLNRDKVAERIKLMNKKGGRLDPILLKYVYNVRCYNPCPCILLGEAALVHLDNVIEELGKTE